MIEFRLHCPVCPEGYFLLTDADMDDLNCEGRLDFQCMVCGVEFTTGLFHWEPMEEYNRKNEEVLRESS